MVRTIERVGITNCQAGVLCGLFFILGYKVCNMINERISSDSDGSRKE